MSMQELIERIRRDKVSKSRGPVPSAVIARLSQLVGVELPKSYVAFLGAFDGGEFRFGRMNQVDPTKTGYSSFEDHLTRARKWSPQFGPAGLIPFGDDWGGNAYCFDMRYAPSDGEPSIVQWNHEAGPDQEPSYVASSFVEFILEAYEENWFEMPPEG